MIKIQSGNLEIISCNLESLKMIAEDKSKLAKKLKIKIPDVWPVSPEAIPIFQEILQSDETMVGWLNYFVIHREDKTFIGEGVRGRIMFYYSGMGKAYYLDRASSNWKENYFSKNLDRLILH